MLTLSEANTTLPVALHRSLGRNEPPIILVPIARESSLPAGRQIAPDKLSLIVGKLATFPVNCHAASLRELPVMQPQELSDVTQQAVQERCAKVSRRTRGRELYVQIRKDEQLHHAAGPSRISWPKPFLIPQ
jgi:hypothetical protein